MVKSTLNEWTGGEGKEDWLLDPHYRTRRRAGHCEGRGQLWISTHYINKWHRQTTINLSNVRNRTMTTIWWLTTICMFLASCLPHAFITDSWSFDTVLSDSQRYHSYTEPSQSVGLTVPIGNPTSQPSSVASYARSTTPLLMSGASHSSAPSVITDNIKIVNRKSTLVKVKTEIPIFSRNNNGGLLDNDELMDEEWEVAVKSPSKGKKRVTSEVGYYLFLYIIQQFESYCDQKLIIQTAMAASKAGSNLKRPSQNEELPDWIDAQWFWYTFVTMYMAFVCQTVDSWDVPIKQAVAIMQKIWNAISHCETHGCGKSSNISATEVRELSRK